MVASFTNSASMARHTRRLQIPKVGASCANYARRDLCGGHLAIYIPTAVSKSWCHVSGIIFAHEKLFANNWYSIHGCDVKYSDFSAPGKKYQNKNNANNNTESMSPHDFSILSKWAFCHHIISIFSKAPFYWIFKRLHDRTSKAVIAI